MENEPKHKNTEKHTEKSVHLLVYNECTGITDE